MTIPPIPNAEHAIDLGEIKRRADERDALEAAAKREEAARELEARAKSWDRAMTRAFKGIMPAPERRRVLIRAIEREEAAAS